MEGEFIIYEPKGNIGKEDKKYSRVNGKIWLINVTKNRPTVLNFKMKKRVEKSSIAE